MSNVVNLTVIKTVANNKTIKPDEDGYYRVTLGAFNVMNSAGMVYSFKGVPEFLKDATNTFNKRLLAGRLRSEADHPPKVPGMTEEQFIMRNLAIPMKTVCAHIKELIVTETNKSENIPGIGNIVLIEGLVKPSGPFSSGLKDSLDNPNEDTCFSIRCFTKDVPTGLHVVKYVKQLVTWDWVGEPGIKYASKLGKPAVESEDIAFGDISKLEINTDVVQVAGTSQEADEQLTALSELVDSCNDSDIVGTW